MDKIRRLTVGEGREFRKDKIFLFKRFAGEVNRLSKCSGANVEEQ